MQFFWKDFSGAMQLFLQRPQQSNAIFITIGSIKEMYIKGNL